MVVSIVALLISILLPSLKKAREQARIMVCTANMRGVAVASLTYATADSGEQAIPLHGFTGSILSDIGAYDWGGKAGSGEPVLGNDPLSSSWGTQQGRGPASRPLNSVLFKDGFTDYRESPGPNQVNWTGDRQLDLSPFRCPSDRGFTGHHFPAWAGSGLTSYDHYGTSYTGNTYWGNWALGADRAFVLSLGPALRPLSSVPNPTHTLYYLENSGRFAWTLGYRDTYTSFLYSSTVLPLSAPGFVRGWHGRPFHFVSAFMDGHAGVIRMRGRIEPPPPLARYPSIDGAVQQTYEFWKSSITRGLGWQKDTHPGKVTVSAIPAELNLMTSVK